MTLCELPGLGPTSQAMLEAAGVRSLDMLKRLGSVATFVLVKRAGCKPSLNLLWGLESAISGMPWREVARSQRTRLLIELDQIESST